jgi:hypothetical protein
MPANCPGGVCHSVCTPGTLTVSQQDLSGRRRRRLEVCNNADDDCDNVVDNGFNKQTDSLNCRTCGTVATWRTPV